jgi:1,4-dihydroxy-2-naphthoate octaprenyltransferase
LIGGILAFSLGALLGIVNGGTFNPSLVVLAYFVVLLGDLSSHYSNDYFDVEVDKNIEQKKIFAGSAVLVKYPNLRFIARSISICLLFCSNFLALLLFLFFGISIEIFLVILCASLVGWFYSAPPLRLISKGFGEVAVAFVTGFAIPAIGYLSVKNQFDPLFLYLAVSFVMYGFMLSLSLEAPDAAIDCKGGKKTLIVRKGPLWVFLTIFGLAMFDTVLLTLYSLVIVTEIMEIGFFAIFSIVPLISALVGFAGIVKKKTVNRFSTLNVASLFIFNTLSVSYLIALVFSM